MQQVFDTGRLASPMWQAYRHEYKDRAKENKKVPWESKWERPEAFKQSVYDFLHLPAYQYEIDHYLDNYSDKVAPTELKGLSGSYSDVSFSLLKHEMAKVKHSSKFNLTAEQKNMMVLPGEFTWYTQQRDFTMMNARWRKFGRGS
jgi:hypothetical protein